METLQDVVKKTMIMGSVGVCQEMCYHDNGYKFGVQVGIVQNITNVSFLFKVFMFN